MRTIQLKKYGVGRYDEVSPFIIAENLELRIDGMTAMNGEYIAVITCNEKKMQVKIDGLLTISKDFLSVGQLDINIVYYLRGEKLSEWVVEPLLLKEVKTELTLMPLIEDLKNQLQGTLKSFENKMQEETDKRVLLEADLKKQVDKTRAIKLATLRYLYRHYTKDLTDSDKDLTVAGFALAIGFDVSDLSEEELNEITEFATKEGVL